jgi:hypothetical protein
MTHRPWLGVLLGWFGYKGRVGPVNCIVGSGG